MTKDAGNKIRLSLAEVHDLAFNCLAANGCDAENARAIADNMTAAERDGSASHGLFRLPGHVTSLRNGKVNGKARPQVSHPAPAAVRCDAGGGYAPLALEQARPALVAAARTQGVAVLAIVRVCHFAALWPEVEALARQGLAAFACTANLPYAAAAGGRAAVFGTNPVAFAWPRPGDEPLSIDMATTAMARGEVMVAARDGHLVPDGVGLDATGAPTRDPAAILNGGVMLPFGGVKGSAISMMVELLAGPLIGEALSVEAGEADNRDGTPPLGGEVILAFDPVRLGGGADWQAHGERLFEAIRASGGEGGTVRLPGDRRHANRAKTPAEGVSLPRALYEKIQELTRG